MDSCSFNTFSQKMIYRHPFMFIGDGGDVYAGIGVLLFNRSHYRSQGESHLGRTSGWANRLVGLVVGVVFVSPCAILLLDQTPSPSVARVLAPGDPVAVITPLPDYVSNGTWWDLDATGSIGTIVNFTWNVTLSGTTTFLYGQSEIYRFQTLGLYKITLTVFDNQSRSNTAFTAVVSVLDSDQDTLPDWWEMKNFKDLDQTASGDPDGDGYDNLEEYANGTDPNAKDPRPTFFQMVKENWIVAVVIAALIVAAILSVMPFLRKRRKVHEKKKIEAAIAIEKAIEGDEK